MVQLLSALVFMGDAESTHRIIISFLCVRDIHKYFLFFIISFLSILILTNIPTEQLDTCLEMVLRSATILLHNLVRKVLANEPPNTEPFEHPCGVSILLPH